MIAAQHRAESPSLHVASAKICASAAETSDSAGPDSEVHTACAMPELSQPVQRAAQSGPADIQSADFSWAPGRHGMSMSGFTADPSAGEFTRGMELLAGAADDPGVSSRAAAVQDDYLMKLLSGRPSSAALNVQLVAKQPAAAVVAAMAADPANSLMGGRQQGVAANSSPAPAVPQQRAASSAAAGPSAAARAALGAQGFAGLRARLLQHQDVFLQQMFDLHRCARRQAQLVAVCDQPEAVAAALESVMASSREASQQIGACVPSAAAAVAAPTGQIASEERPAAVQITPAPAVVQQQPIAAQPRPGAFPYGSVAARFGGLGPMYEGFPGAPVAPPAAFDPMAAWYAHHYGAQQHPYAAAAAPQLHRPAGSLPVMGTFSNAAGSGIGSAGAVYGGGAGFVAASRDPALPRGTASAGVVPAQMAFDGRAVALSHGDRWWQDPAQVFGPAGVPALVERALTLQQEQSGGHGGTVSTRRGNEAQSHLHAKAKTLMRTESMPPKKRSFATSQDDGERAASGSNSPNGHASSQRPRPPKPSQAARKARNGPGRKLRGTSSSSRVGDGKGSDSSGARGPCPGALQSAASVLLSFSAMTE